MFYDVVVNDWGETTYVPTTIGNIVLIVVMILVLGAAMVFAGKHTKKLTVKQLAYCAMSIALGTVLSNIKVFSFPTGGSITLLSMLVICLPGFLFGPGAGIMTGVAYGILQLLIDPYVLYPSQLIVDYLLAFGALGFSGFFSKSENGLLKGYIAGVLGRYLFVVLSGWIFFGIYAWDGWGALPYSLVYNAIYIFAEAAITIIILCIPAVRKMFIHLKKMAV